MTTLFAGTLSFTRLPFSINPHCGTDLIPYDATVHLLSQRRDMPTTTERLTDVLRTIEPSRLTLAEIRAAAVDAAIAHKLDAVEIAQLVDMLEVFTGMSIHQSKF